MMRPRRRRSDYFEPDRLWVGVASMLAVWAVMFAIGWGVLRLLGVV